MLSRRLLPAPTGLRRRMCQHEACSEHREARTVGSQPMAAQSASAACCTPCFHGPPPYLGLGHLVESCGVFLGATWFLRPGFHLLRALSRRRHPTHPTQGPPRGCPPPCPGSPWAVSVFLLNPNLKDRHCRGAGPGPSQLCKNPRARGSQNLPGAPGAWGPQLGQHLAEWRAFGLLSPPPAPLPRGPSSPHQSDAPPSATAGAAHARPLLPIPPGRGWGCVPGLRSPVGQWGAPLQPSPVRRWALGARASTCLSWGALVSGGRGKGGRAGAGGMNKTGWCLRRTPGLPLEAPRSAGSGMGWNPTQEEGSFSWRERAVRAQEASVAGVSDRCWALQRGVGPWGAPPLLVWVPHWLLLALLSGHHLLAPLSPTREPG